MEIVQNNKICKNETTHKQNDKYKAKDNLIQFLRKLEYVIFEILVLPVSEFSIIKNFFGMVHYFST